MIPQSSLTVPSPFIFPHEVRHVPRGTFSEPMAEPTPEIILSEAADDTLIVLFLQGEDRAYRVLVERYQERIRNLIYSIFRDREMVDDIAQEVFVKAYEALPRFRFESSFYTWVYRIAVNKCRDELRRRKVRSFLSFQSLDDGVRSDLEHRLATQPTTSEHADLVALGLKALPAHQRVVLILKDLEGLSYEEIADVLQVEVGTVKSRLSRARATLRKLLTPILREEGS